MNYELIPFLCMAGKTPKLSFPRLVETIVIAIVTAVVINYVSLAVMQKDISYIKEHIVFNDKRIDKLEGVVFVPITKE